MDVKFPEFYNDDMTDAPESPLQRNLKRILADRETNALQAAKKAGLGDSFVRDILRGTSKSPSADNLARLAEALETSVDDLRGSISRTHAEAGVVDVSGLPVVSKVSAGVWLDVTTMDDGIEHDIIPVPHDPRFPRARQYALLVQGDSMDEEYPDGSYVTCVDFWDSGVPIRDGLHVHVERSRGGGQLVEITVKVVDTIDGRRSLAPRSKNPKWQPVPIEGDETTEVVIKGLVTGGWKRAPI